MSLYRIKNEITYEVQWWSLASENEYESEKFLGQDGCDGVIYVLHTYRSRIEKCGMNESAMTSRLKMRD